MQGAYRLGGGMGAIIEALARALDPHRVLTTLRLTKVQHSAKSITAHFSRNGEQLTIEAKQIVLAVPPRVIADTVTFEPALAAAQLEALGGVPTWMAGQAKIMAVYDTPHWRNAGLSGDAMSQRGPMVEIHDASSIEGGPFALFGFVGVPADIRNTHKGNMTALALTQLTTIFGPKMAEPLEIIMQDWATVPEIARPADKRPVGGHPAYGLPANLKGLAQLGIHFGSTGAMLESW